MCIRMCVCVCFLIGVIGCSDVFEYRINMRYYFDLVCIWISDCLIWRREV